MISGTKKKEEIPFSHLSVWFETKIRETNLTKELSEVFNELSESMLILEKQVTEISKKEFPSDQEHLSTYTAALHTFLKQIQLPEKKDVESIVLYEETLSAALSNIKQNSQNMIKLYSKFYPQEAESFSETFDSFVEMQESLHELVKQQHGVFFVYSIQKQIKEIQKKNKTSAEVQAAMQREEEKLQEAEGYKLKLETDYDELKTSPEFEKYDILLSKKVKIENELERENQNMTLLLSPLSKLFADYVQKGLGSDMALARQYSENPIIALHNDSRFFIVDLIKHVSEKLHELEADEKKRLKLRQSLLAVSEEVLRSHRAQYERLKQLQSEVQRQLMLNNTTIKIEDLKYKLSHANEQIKMFKDNRTKYETAIEQINVQRDINALQRQLQSFSEVIIT